MIFFFSFFFFFSFTLIESFETRRKLDGRLSYLRMRQACEYWLWVYRVILKSGLRQNDHAQRMQISDTQASSRIWRSCTFRNIALESYLQTRNAEFNFISTRNVARGCAKMYPRAALLTNTLTLVARCNFDASNNILLLQNEFSSNSEKYFFLPKKERVFRLQFSRVIFPSRWF